MWQGRLVLASQNRHKLEELRRALPGVDVDALGRDDPPQEDGATFEDNARIKARFGRAHAPAGAWALGEDSGIEAVALGGRPGVHTARRCAPSAVTTSPSAIGTRPSAADPPAAPGRGIFSTRTEPSISRTCATPPMWSG